MWGLFLIVIKDTVRVQFAVLNKSELLWLEYFKVIMKCILPVVC